VDEVEKLIWRDVIVKLAYLHKCNLAIKPIYKKINSSFNDRPKEYMLTYQIELLVYFENP